jgi:hypothetical protein
VRAELWPRRFLAITRNVTTMNTRTDGSAMKPIMGSATEELRGLTRFTATIGQTGREVQTQIARRRRFSVWMLFERLPDSHGPAIREESGIRNQEL